MIELIKKTITTKEVYKFVPGKPFNPNFDGNALAWYNGDIGLTNGGWLDQGAGGHDIVFSNLPLVVSPAINGHDAVRFDGINQYGNVATPAVNSPYTIYVVENLLAYLNNARILEDGVVVSAKRLYCRAGVPPNLSFSNGLPIDSNPDLAVGTYGVITCLANGANSEIRTNLNASIVGNAGANNGAGIAVGARTTGAAPCNCEMAFLIIRTGADSTATQNRIINALMARFAL